MIELGLARIGRLLEHSPLLWRAIHVAGTNGKGSVCAYTSAMLRAGNVRCGRFTSPHLIDRWDCIAIDDKTVAEDLFREIEDKVKYKNHRDDIRASEFEILAATAFEIFSREKVVIGVVEVGLGGRLDATNILENQLATVITKIGIDHQPYLGNTIEEITKQKAGIMRNGVDCFADGSNEPSIIRILSEHAKLANTASFTLVPRNTEDIDHVWSILPKHDFETHQQINILLAYEVVKRVVSCASLSLDPRQLLPAIRKMHWPGRLQRLSIQPLTGRKEDVVLDGAHNAQSAGILGSHVDNKIRTQSTCVTWVIAISKGRDNQELLSYLLKSGDTLIATKFAQVDGMPWVHSAEVDEISDAARKFDVADHSRDIAGTAGEALRLATELSKGGPLVIAGSLYLVSDVCRLLREAE